MRHPAVILFAMLLPLGLAACGEPEDTGPGRPVAHRREAFKSILRAFEPIGVSLRADKYAPDRIIAMAEQLNRVKDGPWGYFTPGSDYPPSRATAKVWSEREQFEAGRRAFSAATESLLAAAAARDEARVRAAYEVLEATCRDCHKVYKR
ncbi:MAG: cytochrome c [Rhodocyclales bacterium]|nr:cytochrome c [Rhodocyclales bacterium]